jgi:hypothetical protein
MSNGIAVFLRWWSAKCGRNWAILGAIVAGLIGMFTLYNLASPVVAEMRPWATRHEVGLVADRVYPRALADQQTKTLSLENRLKWLKERGQAGKLNPEQWGEISVIEGLIWDSKTAEARIIREQTLFELQRQHR